MSTHRGVIFPTDSTSATGRDTLAEALKEVDPAGSRAASQETNWRRNYVTHFHRAVDLGLDDRAAALSIAHHGLEALHSQFRYIDAEGTDMALDVACTQAAHAIDLSQHIISPSEDPEEQFTLPYKGERLSGLELEKRLNAWLADGIITEGAALAIRKVAANPEWLSLDGHTVVVLGAASEMGPTRALQRWGATVAAVDLPRRELQEDLISWAKNSAGTTIFPKRQENRFGADMLHELAELSTWVRDLPGQVVLGTYAYADGATHVRVAMAGDALATDLLAQRPDSALAFLATPTDVFAVNESEVTRANRAYQASLLGKTVRMPLRVVSGGRLLQRNYPPNAQPGICDSLVTQQGPNYALAKRIHRWRAAAARDAGTTVSMNVAPATRTRSVVKNRALAAAYAGAHRFGVEVFDPATASTIMAALLVHDLKANPPAQDLPWQDEAIRAVHGGLWTSAYSPASALGLAAVMGLATARA